jgi:hypothetical protein
MTALATEGAMHEVLLHRLPRRGTVLREQFLAVGLSLRREGAVVGVLAGAFTLMVVLMQASTGIALGFNVVPEAGIPLALLALLVPMAVWKGEDPARRVYHRAMPVGHGEHAVVRTLAGLPWVLAAGVAYFFWLLALSAMSGGLVEPTPLWQWAAPFAGVVVTYLLGSALALRVAHPWRWLGGGAVAYLFVRALQPVHGASSLAGIVDAVLRGRYGLRTVITGTVSVPVHEDFGYMPAFASAGVWLLATWLWVAVALSLFLWSAYRQPES